MIYEDDAKQEKPSHTKYKEYKKKMESDPKSNENLILFVSAFFIMLLLFLGIVKQLSPEVDVSIGNSETQKNEEIEKGSVDDRLRVLQLEDNSYNSQDETFSPELEEKVRLPHQKVKTAGEREQVAEVIFLDTNKEDSSLKNNEKGNIVKQDTVENKSFSAPVPAISAKVIVGYYATAEQAEVAKGIILDSGLNMQPFVKNIGGAYTLQVGSFSSREKAQSVANDLLKNNFPARVIIE